MADFGNITIYLLIVLSTWSGALALVGARRRSMSTIHAARLMLNATAVIATLSMVVLTYAFAASDFSLDYVQHYSDRSMPMFYKLTAVWGGQEGSLLLWTWLLAVFSAWAVHINQERLRELVPYVIIVLVLVIDFFCILLLKANPFDTFLIDVPIAGRGLNPLLQNAYMVTHPPSLYVGYVGMAIPFAFAVAALIAGQTDESWILAARPWALASWYFLSLGLVLGMLWAYEELGWGGYWAWDPVENAGLIPWLTSTAYVHSVMVQERRQMLKVWNMALAIITFELTIFGTFLTRSGFIQSVHAFAKSSIGWYFLAFMAAVAIVSVGLIVWRIRLLRGRGRLESVLSRELMFLFNNWVLLTAAFLVIFLTIFPTITQALIGNKINISAPAFNSWMVPVGVALLLLTGIGPMMGWRKSSGGGLLRQFLAPLIIGLGVVILLFVLGARGALPLATFGLCAFVVSTVIQELIRGVGIRRRSTGADPFTALIILIIRNRRRYGGYIVHVGVVLMYLGFAGEAYKQESEVELNKGNRAAVGDYQVRFDGLRRHSDEQKEMFTARLAVYRGGEHIGDVRPARWVYYKHQDQPTTEVGIRRSAKEDLFVVLGGFSDDLSRATFKVIVNPLVNWIWIGFVLLTIGAVIALIPSRARAAGGAGSRAAAAATVVLLALLATGDAAADKPPPAPPATAAAAVKQVPELEQRLFSKIACMCPTCPRLPLSTCQCGFAAKERSAIRAKLRAGWTEAQVLRWYMERRGPELGREPFGGSALTKPPDTGFNRISWLLPYALSGLGAVLLIVVGLRWARGRRRGGEAVQEAPSPADGATPKAAASTAKDKTYDDLLDRELDKLD